MAKKRKETADGQAPEQNRFVCGECEKAYGFCMPAFDHSPIGCRCGKYPGRALFCTQLSCGDFARRSSPVPDRVEVFLSEDRFLKDCGEKKVPLFRKGEKDPWKWVKVSDIPPGGISWTGEPLGL